jgi:hypothetical protein
MRPQLSPLAALLVLMVVLPMGAAGADIPQPAAGLQPPADPCSCSFQNGMWQFTDRVGSNWVSVPGPGACQLQNLVDGRTRITPPQATAAAAAADAGAAGTAAATGISADAGAGAAALGGGADATGAPLDVLFFGDSIDVRFAGT